MTATLRDSSFTELHKALEPILGFDRPWLVAGGWAIDLYLGRSTRPHKDVDIAIFRQDQLRLQGYLEGWGLYIAESGKLQRWQPGEYIELPLHGIWAYAPGREPERLVDPTIEDYPDLEFLFNERSETDWLFRKDLSIKRALTVALMQRNGIPFLAPEIVLLYKSSGMRATDIDDFLLTKEAMSEEQLAWLRKAIERGGSQHPWLA